ncbi:Na(+)/H(+) antiporter subunit B [Marinitoga arctica]
MQIIEIVVGIILLVFGFLAIESKKIINSVIYLSILSMLAVISFVFMKAPDVAITEAVIGSGLVTAIFIFTLFSIKKVGDKK